MDITELQKKFSQPGKVEIFAGKGGLPFLRVVNDAASAEICLQGAHLTSFRAKNQEDLLWMCSNSYFEAGKPLRGGVPICWPWFGPHPSDKTLPAHGFARIMMWNLLEIRQEAPALTLVKLQLKDSPETRKFWDHSFVLTLEISIGSILKMALTTENTGSTPVTVSEALHTYFNISDAEKISIDGLDGQEYMNKVAGANTLEKQEGSLRISRENDSVFQNYTAPVTVTDPGFSRKITIEKEGSQSTVIWNPWIEKSKKMPDFTPDSYHTMLCVEAANALDNTLTIAPGESHCTAFTAAINSL